MQWLRKAETSREKIITQLQKIGRHQYSPHHLDSLITEVGIGETSVGYCNIFLESEPSLSFSILSIRDTFYAGEDVSGWKEDI